MNTSILYPLIGGGIIGLAVSIMLLFNGRVTGISGIVASALSRPSAEGLWRWLFLGGMIAGGFIMGRLKPEAFANLSGRSTPLIILAGLLVGYGTVMGGGCTSGHGVCGMSRLSVRSLIATFIFMLFGFLSVQAMRFLTGGSL
jgi:uncharacterized membrane protein YedE/YeeE